MKLGIHPPVAKRKMYPALSLTAIHTHGSRPDMEPLRQVQLTISRNPGKITELAAGFRTGFKEVKGSETAIKPMADEKAHPRLWAAFTLSGPGR